MTEWALFIGLKLLEIGTVVFVPWLVGGLVFRVLGVDGESLPVKWVMGLLIVLAIPLLGWMIWTRIGPAFINWNWSLVERIMQ